MQKESDALTPISSEQKFFQNGGKMPFTVKNSRKFSIIDFSDMVTKDKVVKLHFFGIFGQLRAI